MMTFKAINTQGMTNDEIDLFISSMREVIGTSHGNTPNFIKSMNLDRLHPLRFLLGRDNFTPDQLKFAEGIYCLVKNQPIRHCPNIWSDTLTWHPGNARKSDNRLDDIIFDSEFTKTIIKAKKDLEMLLDASSTTILKLESGSADKLDIIRAQIALMRFGFPEPERFFESR